MEPTRPHDHVAVARGSQSFKKTGMSSEEETGRTDEEGRVFKKTGMFSEEEVGISRCPEIL